jgi:hypothetical protein
MLFEVSGQGMSAEVLLYLLVRHRPISILILDRDCIDMLGIVLLLLYVYAERDER